MIAVIPACFESKEVLARQGLAAGFTLRAVRAARQGGCKKIAVFSDDPGIGLEAAKAGAEVHLAVYDAEEGPLPPGARQAFAACREAGEDMALIDPRNPQLGGVQIRSAAERLKVSRFPYLLSVKRPKDHPCQGKLFLNLREIGTVVELGSRAAPMPSWIKVQVLMEGVNSRLPGSVLLGAGQCVGSGASALLVERPGDGAYLLLSGCEALCGSEICEIYEPSRSLRITCKTVSANPPMFRLAESPEQGFGSLAWMLLEPSSEAGAHDLRLNFEPEGAPWLTDPGDLDILNTASCRGIRGRQDFPDVFSPDGSLVLIAAGAPFPDSGTVEALGFEALILEPRDAIRVRTELDLIRYETIKEGGANALGS